MKILFLTNQLDIGGVSNYVINVAKELKQKGYRIFCASSGGKLVNELDKSGIRHYHLPLDTKNELSPKLIVAFFRLVEIVNREGIDIIHAHTRIGQILAQLINKFYKVPFVSTCHGFHKRRFLRKLYPCWGDRIIAVSEPIREHLVNNLKVPKARVAVVHNGIDLKKFDSRLTDLDKIELRHYYQLGDYGLVVGGVSRFAEMKGFQYLLKAVPEILKKYPQTKFFLIGEGKYKNELVKFADRLEIKENVVFTGAIEDITFPLEIIDIFVLPSVRKEAFGLAILEAMSKGRPIVATNVGGIYSLVREGGNGFLVPPSDSSALADAIGKLLESAELRMKMGRRSRELAEMNFSLDKVADQLIEAYSSVLEERKKMDLRNLTKSYLWK